MVQSTRLRFSSHNRRRLDQLISTSAEISNAKVFSQPKHHTRWAGL